MADRRSHLRKPIVVGVLNITPDSFSDGGNFFPLNMAIQRAESMIGEGADVIEVGGESTRPGATPVSLVEELHRVLPVITEIVARWPATRVSVDTVKSEVAARAIDAGASVVNDVSALRLDQRIASVCAASGCDLVLMHSRGDVSDMGRYDHATYEDSDPVGAVISELRCAAQIAIDAGVDRARIVLDPGLGFAKRAAQSVRVLANLPRLLDLGFDVMVGASRKRFIGELTGVQQPAERDAGTVGANVAALMLGATWFRVHDVRANRAALDVAAAILEARA
ncbi:MAG: dihydropteroate synthase [Gemmatimonadaceae bacterium]